MLKRKYHFEKFPPPSKRNCLTKCSEHVLEMTERIFEILHGHDDESADQSPWQILHNLIQNNAHIFGLKVSDIISYAGTSSPEKSSQESSNQWKDVPRSSYLQQKLPFMDKPNGALVHKYLVSPDEKLEILSSSIVDKVDFATNKDAKKKISPKEETSILSSEDINALLARNLVQIRSVSIIRHSELMIEVGIGSACMPEKSSPESPEQGSSPSRKIHCSLKLEKNAKSPTRSSSKSSIHRLPSLTVDYSDPILLNYLSERLLSILSCRKAYMKKIHNYFETFLSDARHFHVTIRHLKYVVENHPKENEPYLTNNFLKFQDDLINKASEMLEKAKSLIANAKDDIRVSKTYLEGIDSFENEFIPSLSPKSASKLIVTDLKKIKSHLKDISNIANGTVIIKDYRRTILLNSTSIFKWLVNHFVKFLIITGTLKPLFLDSYHIGKNR